MFSNTKAVKNLYFAKKAKRTLQAALEKVKIGNLFKTPKDIKANTKIIIDNSVAGIETLLDIITITLQNGRESD